MCHSKVAWLRVTRYVMTSSITRLKAMGITGCPFATRLIPAAKSSRKDFLYLTRATITPCAVRYRRFSDVRHRASLFSVLVSIGYRKKRGAGACKRQSLMGPDGCQSSPWAMSLRLARSFEKRLLRAIIQSQLMFNFTAACVRGWRNMPQVTSR